MIIIAGHELVNAERRDTFVAAFRELITRARDFDGCIHVAITADSVAQDEYEEIRTKAYGVLSTLGSTFPD